MNLNIRKLHRIASKKSRTIIGLMSGTSLDGLDVALCRFTGAGTFTKVTLLRFETVSYPEDVKARIRQVFARREISFSTLCEMNPWIADLHADMVLACLKKWRIRPAQVDVIASHGQTVFHAPHKLTPGTRQNSTLQIGDGDHLAVRSGIITFSDFRQKHIAAGGEGAPLAMYGDFLLFSRKGEERVLLNIGGIGNFTYLPASGKPGKVMVTDTGPGNTLLDQFVQRHWPGQSFDRDGALGRKGSVHEALLRALKDHPFFQLPLPRTTGPELFNLEYVERALAKIDGHGLKREDILATLTRFSGDTIAEAIRSMKLRNPKIYVSGGGAHNPLLLESIRAALPKSHLAPIEVIGMAGDAKEAVLFAVLANESLVGGKVNFGKRAGIPSVSMGKVSFPS